MLRKVFEISPVLWIITLFFLGRVLGQGLVYFLEVTWLPPLKQWYSGLLAYEYLLPTQCGILLLMFRINIDVMRQRGFFSVLSNKSAQLIIWIAYLYATGMVFRYVLTMYWHPDRRWVGEGTIPVVFHLLLALYLYLYARYSNRVENKNDC